MLNEIQAAKNGCVKSQSSIIEHLTPNIKFFCSKYKCDIRSEDEIMNDARIGILNGINTFDTGKSKSWKFHILLSARRAVTEGFRETNLIYLPKNTYRVSRKQTEKGVSDSLKTHIDSHTFTPMSMHLQKTQESIGPSVLELKDESRPELDMVRNCIKEFINKHIDILPEREQFIIKSYFWDEKTLEEIAAELNLTRERVRQIKYDTLKMLQTRVRELKP